MIRLSDSLSAWGSTEFEEAFKKEVQALESGLLPLQAGLANSSYVSDGDIRPVILNISDNTEYVKVKAGVFYAGIIAGSCCADDPSPVDEQTEYCELQFIINKNTAETVVTLLES